MHALEGYSESLDHEVREFGVRVAVIEPAATRTSFEASTVNADRPLSADDASRTKYLVAFERAMAIADPAESVVETIVRAALDMKPRLRYTARKVPFRSLASLRPTCRAGARSLFKVLRVHLERRIP
jgi:short-subunit dehydrogenase